MRRALCVLFFVFFPAVSQAATLYIDPGMATLYRGDAVTMSVRLMPDQVTGECINAADVVVVYPESIQPVDVSTGRSIFSVWIEDPVINKESRTITFAGGIPNGYCGRVQGDPGLTNIIADIIFRSPGFQIGSPADGGEAVISFSPETSVYLNDGQGTKAPLLTLPSTITLEKNAGPGIVDEWREAVRADDTLPESFSIQLERDGITFGGRYYIIFSTSDKQTGISHYEVMEEPVSEFGSFSWGRTDAPWERTVSPYVLKDQSLNSIIRVRAYDKAGNEYVATLIPDESLQTLSKGTFYIYVGMGVAILVFVVVLVILVMYVLRRQRKLRNSADETSDDERSDTEDVKDII